jgi:hypothetical protein
MIKITLTSIPTRFDKLGHLSPDVWLNIPYTYSRFPDWDGSLPDVKCNIKRCDDTGPATKVFPVALDSDPEDIIVYIDDDTYYDPLLIRTLVKWVETEPDTVWGTSGFTLMNYFNKFYPRGHYEKVDVIEGYGAVAGKAKWFQKIYPEFLELKGEAKYADDLIISNLLEGIGVPRKTVCTKDCNIGMIRQYTYGFEDDSLHKQTPGGHHESYANILRNLTPKGKNYFKYNDC